MYYLDTRNGLRGLHGPRDDAPVGGVAHDGVGLAAATLAIGEDGAVVAPQGVLHHQLPDVIPHHVLEPSERRVAPL